MQKMVAAAANTTPSLGRRHRFMEAGLLAGEASEGVPQPPVVPRGALQTDGEPGYFVAV